MRLEGRKKGGFYAADPAAIDHVFKTAISKVDEKSVILDPCCGEGEAIHRIAQTLSTKDGSVYCCELEPNRYESTKDLMPNANVLNGDWLGVGCTINSFSFAWVNPPFDHELKGGKRMEHEFLKHTTRLMTIEGIMCLICPESVGFSYSTQQHFSMFYEDVRMIRFPDDVRKYNEVAILGRKRRIQVDDHYEVLNISKTLYETGDHKYIIPRGFKPHVFQRSVLLEHEIDDAMARSPLCHVMKSAPIAKPMSPPLALGKGHVALLLSSGYLNGVVSPPDEPPHVVRGTARKIDYVSDISSDDSGSTTVTKSQKISMVVRAVGPDGDIKTFDDKPEDATETQFE